MEPERSEFVVAVEMSQLGLSLAEEHLNFVSVLYILLLPF